MAWGGSKTKHTSCNIYPIAEGSIEECSVWANNRLYLVI